MKCTKIDKYREMRKNDRFPLYIPVRVTEAVWFHPTQSRVPLSRPEFPPGLALIGWSVSLDRGEWGWYYSPDTSPITHR